MKAYLRTLVFLSVLVATPALACDPSASNACEGEACPTLGLTQMQRDGKKLLACLKNASNVLIWAAMSSGLSSTPGSCGTTLNREIVFGECTDHRCEGTSLCARKCVDGTLSSEMVFQCDYYGGGGE